MKIGVFGTGMVGRSIAGKLVDLGHEVMIGTRDVNNLFARTEPDGMGNPPFSVWQTDYSQVQVGTYEATAAHGAIVFNCTSGSGALPALEQAGAANLNGKVVIDISNPLDFSQGMPPSLFVSNTDSLGEQLQRAFPDVKIVKTLNTVNANLMVDPGLVNDGDHSIFVSGDDADAKAQVADILSSWFGWQDVIDLGDITTARGTEMVLPIWVRLWGALQTPMFNLKVVR
ncbi:MAG: NAD(P)-binding domain-containing protein [Chloroflexota bacterium]